MSTLTIIPTRREHEHFLNACQKLGVELHEGQIGYVPIHLTDNLVIAQGGLGKTQFAITTQHLIDLYPHWKLIICAGAAGGLSHDIAIADIVVATETREHDVHNGFGPPMVPSFKGDDAARALVQQLASKITPNRVHQAIIASGDEDIMSLQRQQDVIEKTNAVAVAWEGAGGARACQFSNVPFLELRGVSDHADSNATEAFLANLPRVMKNLATLCVSLAESMSSK